MATNPNLQMTLGRLHLRAGKPELAVPILEKVAQQAPWAAEPLLLLYEAQATQGKFEEAEQALVQAAEVNPRYYSTLGQFYERQGQWADAATAYDYAFNLYANLDENTSSLRPYRMMWYQTGPYRAYYYANRFSDVINLADTTLNDTIAEPVLEESLYWRGKANYMAGQTDLAITDYRAALKFHPNWGPALQALQDLGAHP
jgi:tetratricopeptide (TPR) repeat protein